MPSTRSLGHPATTSGRASDFGVGEYVILYRIIDDRIEIVLVVHGRRDLFGLF